MLMVGEKMMNWLPGPPQREAPTPTRMGVGASLAGALGAARRISPHHPSRDAYAGFRPLRAISSLFYSRSGEIAYESVEVDGLLFLQVRATLIKDADFDAWVDALEGSAGLGWR